MHGLTPDVESKQARVGLSIRTGHYYGYHDPSSTSEVKFMGTVDVAEIQGIADGLATGHRELDTVIQEMNWKTELSS